MSQVIIGWYLTEAQVGTYALSLGIVGVTTLWRTGGLAQVLPSLRAPEFSASSGPLLAWGSACSTVSAAITAIVASRSDLLARWIDTSGADGLPAVLWVFALRSLLIPTALLGRARLNAEHRFVELAKADGAFSIIRVIVTWVIASQGGGALALAIPIVLQFAMDIAVAAILGGYRRADFQWRWPDVRAILPSLGWPFLLAILASARTDANFLLISLALPASALGVFYFSFQLANQPTMFLSSTLQSVLGALVAKSRGVRDLERLNVERVLRMSMLFVPITTMAVASLFVPLERLAWSGKWEAAAIPIVLLSVSSTFATVSGLLAGPLLGLARYKEIVWFDILRLTGMVSGAAIGAAAASAVDDERSAVITASAGVAIGVSASSIAQLLWAARAFGIKRSEFLQTLLFGPTLAALTALAASSIGSSIAVSMNLGQGRVRDFAEFVAVSLVYTLLIVLSVRFTAENVLRESTMLLPARLRKTVERLLRLSHSPGSNTGRT